MLLVFALEFTAFAALALAMDKHHAQVFGRASASGWVTGLRLGGALLLLLALVCAVEVAGPSIGAVLWTVLLTLAALGASVLLTYRPRWLPIAAVLLPLLGGAQRLV